MIGFKPSEDQRKQIEKYLAQLEKERLFRAAIVNGEKRYDERK